MANPKNPNYRLTGINPLAYMGVEPYTPPGLTVQQRRPTVNDKTFNIGQFWIWRQENELWVLINLNQGVATWIQLEAGGGSGATDFPTNSGTATEVGGELNVFGTSPITTTGSGNTVTVLLENGSNGQLLIGGGAGAAWANLTSGNGSIVIANGPNSIDITTQSGDGITQIDTDSGSVGPIAGVIEIIGGELINTEAAGNIITINLDRGNDGEVPIASTGNPTVYANITSVDNSITITNGPNSIDLSAQSDVNPAALCNFFMYQNGIPAVFGSATPGVFLGQYQVMGIRYDVGSNCFIGDGLGALGLPATFTAPATGKYLLGAAVETIRIGSTIPNQNMQIAIYSGAYDPLGSPYNIYTFNPTINVSYVQVSPFQKSAVQNGDALVDMQSGDTAVIILDVGSGSTINGGGSNNTVTFFWGYRLV